MLSSPTLLVSIKMENESHADGLLNDSPTSTVHLHLDVIYIILSFLPQPDLIRAMSTCRTLNHAGVRHLLNFDVHLDSTRKIESFCAFMVVQAPLRYPFLCQLSIGGLDRPVSSESINQLVEILTHTSCLETLHLTCCDLLKSHHRLRAACSSLTSLKEFHMSWNGGPVSWAKDPLYQMVKQMQSPLVKVHLRSFGYIGRIGLDPAVLLHHCSTTLEDLTIYATAFQSELQFPRVRKLSLSSMGYPPLALTARNFPNLTDLTILRDIDRLNVADHQYRQLNHSVQLAGGGWKSLDRLAGWPLDLYKLGLTCQIRRVEFSCVYRDTHDIVTHILSDCRPSHVRIGLTREFPCVRCIPNEVAARLTYLRCTINLMYFFEKSDALFIVDGSITRDLMFVRQFRPELFASKIIASHPSIRYIAIQINWADPLFWKVLTMGVAKLLWTRRQQKIFRWL
ncbi:hypothetical protein A0H81_08810 [Grifola frondosa]|uniref:F-box domain-containing protein n=1 Tax=Grifola frondosa TaxID=5627 RepID=A0A1C7M4A0_GRIFR|nr:hypothetical protein A0H81_08810 [Grifola frondosa]